MIKSKEVSYELIWGEFQDTLLSEKLRGQMIYCVYINKKGL